MSTLGKNIVISFVILVILTQGQCRSLDVRQIKDEEECKPACPNNRVYCDQPICYPGRRIEELLNFALQADPTKFDGLWDTAPTMETRSKRSVEAEDRCTVYQTLHPRVATSVDKLPRFIVNNPMAVQEVEVGTCSSVCQHENCSQLFDEIQLPSTNEEGVSIILDKFSFPSRCLCA